MTTPLSASSPDDVTAVCAAHDLTLDEFHALQSHAQEAKTRAYCPYSKFRVGAALLTRSGAYVTGANVENASYPVTTCAERVAFGTAVVAGYHQQQAAAQAGNGNAAAAGGGEGGFKAVAVATDAVGPASPCGMCRQCIREFCDLSVPIIMFDKDSKFIVMKLEELLPLSFGPDALGAPDPAKS
ncbi:cytidine deaminase [Parathielavia appendiculata]|uniref:Cytidine deaminase n=1 Tax=Parathielavia appendiculata TaxID=2587402 RepID=A0AAN6UAQ7_9PEZI|nr:cytidine deaminase [Parathielavia appendiculata]